MTFLSKIKVLWRLAGIIKVTKPGQEVSSNGGTTIIIEPGLTLPVKFISFQKVTTTTQRVAISIDDMPKEFENENDIF
jgi:hypothetical protein